ncbi:hypothetical protein ACL02S_17725 [Nocardia sp. 004]|uniref:hypothetical protein n=1 Tax=Nocardia sp. 004 TaxID=3385978 RepID=UPI0039A04223
MTRVGAVLACVLAVVLIELVAIGQARELLLVAAGIPVAVGLGWLVWSLFEQFDTSDESDIDEMENGPAEILRRWQARAQMLVDRADGTRAEWDRHLRPLLAKEFELASGQRATRNRRAVEAAGIHQFGHELWRWVDPVNSALRDQTGRAPGRAALAEILSRLQRM